MLARGVVCLLCVAGAAAGKLQVSRAARQAAKARLGGDITELVRALSGDLAFEAEPSMGLAAQLARERLGMEAAELEQASPAEAMMLRALVGSAPDSVLVMPPQLMDVPPMPSGMMIVEQDVSAPPIDDVPIERAAAFRKKPDVKEAVRHLTSEMHAIEERMGRKALEDIISEFFAESQARNTPEAVESKTNGSPSTDTLKPLEVHSNKTKAAMVEQSAKAGQVPNHQDHENRQVVAHDVTKPAVSALKAPASGVAKPAAPTATKAALPDQGTHDDPPAVAHHAAKPAEPALKAAHASGAAKSAAPVAKAAPGPAAVPAAGKPAEPAGSWPKGSSDATWSDRTTTFQRKCDGGRCVTRLIRRRR